jgi:hypothetical protein
MARKRKGDSSQPATTQATHTENDQAKASPSKTEAVEEALEQGMTSPTEIAAHLKTAYGLDITTNYVSMIKTTLKKKKPKSRKPERKPRVEKETAKEPAAKPAPVAKEGGLTPQDLRTLTDLASRVGGYDRLREFIDVLGDVRWSSG